MKRRTLIVPFAGRAAAWLAAAVVAAVLAVPAPPVRAQGSPGVVYKCPGPPVLYTDQLTPEEARQKGCRTIEGAPVTIVQGVKPRAPAAASAPRPPETRTDSAEQRARDSDARRILDDELRREQERLATMQREYNNGQPERLGNERNYQKYLDRVAQMKAAIERKQSDIEAIRRELAKLPSP